MGLLKLVDSDLQHFFLIGMLNFSVLDIPSESGLLLVHLPPESVSLLGGSLLHLPSHSPLPLKLILALFHSLMQQH